jgi:hypothetical protein
MNPVEFINSPILSMIFAHNGPRPRDCVSVKGIVIVNQKFIHNMSTFRNVFYLVMTGGNSESKLWGELAQSPNLPAFLVFLILSFRPVVIKCRKVVPLSLHQAGIDTVIGATGMVEVILVGIMALPSLISKQSLDDASCTYERSVGPSMVHCQFLPPQ